MKKIIPFLLLAALIFLSAAGIFSCRTVKKLTTQADSTINRTSQASEKWDRETITDYGYPASLVVPEQIRTIVEKDSTLLTLLQFFLSQKQSEPAKPVIIRQVVRDSGEKQQAASEEKTIQVEQKQVDKTGRSPWQYIAAGAVGMLLILLLTITAYKLLKARILSAIPK